MTELETPDAMKWEEGIVSQLQKYVIGPDNYTYTLMVVATQQGWSAGWYRPLEAGKLRKIKGRHCASGSSPLVALHGLLLKKTGRHFYKKVKEEKRLEQVTLQPDEGFIKLTDNLERFICSCGRPKNTGFETCTDCCLAEGTHDLCACGRIKKKEFTQCINCEKPRTRIRLRDLETQTT